MQKSLMLRLFKSLMLRLFKLLMLRLFKSLMLRLFKSLMLRLFKSLMPRLFKSLMPRLFKSLMLLLFLTNATPQKDVTLRKDVALLSVPRKRCCLVASKQKNVKNPDQLASRLDGILYMYVPIVGFCGFHSFRLYILKYLKATESRF